MNRRVAILANLQPSANPTRRWMPARSTLSRAAARLLLFASHQGSSPLERRESCYRSSTTTTMDRVDESSMDSFDRPSLYRLSSRRGGGFAGLRSEAVHYFVALVVPLLWSYRWCGLSSVGLLNSKSLFYNTVVQWDRYDPKMDSCNPPSLPFTRKLCLETPRSHS
jgi:hypothetical protein